MKEKKEKNLFVNLFWGVAAKEGKKFYKIFFGRFFYKKIIGSGSVVFYLSHCRGFSPPPLMVWLHPHKQDKLY